MIDFLGIVLFFFFYVWMLEICSVYFGFFLTCGMIEITTSGWMVKVAGSSLMFGYFGV